MKLSPIEIDLGTATMNCTLEEVATTLAALLREMRSVIPVLREDERELLRRIMSSDNGPLTVRDVFADFTRESAAHKTLRRLRAAQFVRPAKTGKWSPEEEIEVKPFARLMWEHLGEDEIFKWVARPATPATAPVAEQEEVVPEAEPAAAAWENNDVLDLRDYDDLRDYAEQELREQR